MSFLTAKGGATHAYNSNHFDQTLATGSQYTQDGGAPSSSASASFRNASSSFKGKGALSIDAEFQQFASSSQHSPSMMGLPPQMAPTDAIGSLAPPPAAASLELAHAAMSPHDGADVLAFLDHGDYEQQVNGDDLIEGSMSYQSYQHQADRQNSLLELEKQRARSLEQWILSDDIVDYIQKTDSTYVDDVYALPPLVQSLLKEAKQDIKESKQIGSHAVSRLRMIREHLISRSNGNRARAAQTTAAMSNDEWASMFAAM
ncbi:hypothetical protein BC940DRAFT_295970 [Gongronella butleri]|nr:hypothetical protein BC940DRAFT_295970 [Gongronella butleri]